MVRLVASILSILLCGMLPGQDGFHLKSGDRVVFYGDSITDQRLYTTFVETYAVTRFPASTVTFVHSGWGGDRVTGGGGGPIEVRLKRDVFAYKPTAMTIMLGMNDARYRAFDQQIFDEYANGYRAIVKSVKTTLPNVRLTAIQPSPFDDVTRAPNVPGGYNSVLVRYGQFVKELAAAEKLAVADLNTPVVSELERAKSLDAAGAERLIPDRVHPGPAGHLLMAKALLRAWNAPAIVTSVEIEGSRGAVVRSENTVLTELAKNGGILTWSQTDKALPMPLNLADAGIALAVKASDFEQTLNRQPLRIAGLASGKYTVRIDGETVGTFSADQLASGVNLAMLPTPMSKQAAEVHALTLKHNNVHFARWRQVEVPLETDGLTQVKAAMDALDRLEQEIVERQRASAQPKARRYELRQEDGK